MRLVWPRFNRAATAPSKAELQSITRVLADVKSATTLTSSDKSTLLAQITADQSGLTALDATIKGDTTVAQALIDCAKVVTGYRWWMMEDPKAYEVVAADKITSVISLFSSFETTLQSAINTYTGPNKTAVQAAFTDLTTKVTSASSSVGGVVSSVISLVPSDCPGCTTTLKTARTNLGSARADLLSARSDVRNILSDIRK